MKCDLYIHIGNNVMIRDDEIIGIFDLDTSTVKNITMKYLNKMESKNRLISVSNDLPKTFIVCSTDDGDKVYLSNLMSSTLEKRQI